MIKESSVLIGQEGQLTTPNQKWWSQMLPSLKTNSMQKLRYQLILSKDIDDQKILQSDWTRGTTGHTQPKEVVPDAPDLHAKNLRDFWISSRNTDDQKILQSDWTGGTTGQT